MLLIRLIHGGEVVHVGNEDVELNDLIQARAGGFKDMFEVLDDLMLGAEISECTGAFRVDAYGALLYSARDNTAVLVHADGARDEDEASCFDGVREDVFDGHCHIGGDDCFSLGHGGRGMSGLGKDTTADRDDGGERWVM